jgi:hypothetical protein
MRLLITVAALTMAIPALAVDSDSFQLKTGADLVELCSVPDEDLLRPNALGMCHGFLEGAYQYYEATEPASNRFICAPNPPPTRAKVMGGFVIWARAHPQYLEEGAVNTLFRYLDKAYPCSQ